MKQERRPISVEDLLRLKRVERPADEFWQQFDRELRAKQLSALVAKRPWWQRLPAFPTRLAQYRLPLGAAAALAVTFVSVRNYSADVPVPASAPGAVAASLDPVSQQLSGSSGFEAAGVETVTLAAAAGEPLSRFAETASSSSSAKDAFESAEVRAGTDSQVALGLARIVPLFGGSEIALDSDLSPSARNIAANLQVAERNDTLGGGLLTAASGRGFESRALPVRAAIVDPLQQMTPPGEPRRSRYLTAMVVSTVADESLDRTTARMAHRISGEELYEQVQRFGTRRGGFNVKF